MFSTYSHMYLQVLARFSAYILKHVHTVLPFIPRTKVSTIYFVLHLDPQLIQPCTRRVVVVVVVVVVAAYQNSSGLSTDKSNTLSQHHFIRILRSAGDLRGLIKCDSRHTNTQCPNSSVVFFARAQHVVVA